MGTLRKLLEKHGKRKAIVGLTAWDYPSGLLAQRAGGIDMVLVSDSLGKIVLGLPGSIGLSLDDMIHHAKAVARAVKTPFLLADLPMGSYEISPEQALTSAIRMIKEAPGVSGVKLEGGKEIIPQVSKITSAGIPVFCQVGITPQRTIQTANDEEGTGRSEVSASEIFDDAICLQNAGAVGIMLTAVSQEAAKLMRDHLTVPTIGIGYDLLAFRVVCRVGRACLTTE
ncbi:ketopantoate hydroxymethyltransferase [Tuber borchii]|uniref:3-methyl-2-oxobutanoate hydroxymethyltransferase n=1 Tax=Tuber borchii TaxID=42251 RepID=A0A2T7A5S3_TUBBO|nr:ketopantoate hydroxymethyltransferase [Tuber borchii]